MNKYFLKISITILLLFLGAKTIKATGEPSTYFNIFVPPNNNAVQRNVCLVITAISDSTCFFIKDDALDGDTDDCKSGVLMAGQSYILYIKDNGINDDALYASGGVLKRDGDYFIITSNKNMYASQSTNSDWQHDWVPGVSQSSLSQKFIIYATVGSGSKRDFNVFAYQDSTFVTLRKISTSPTIQTGYTNIDTTGGTVIFQQMINRGQDLIHFYTQARDIMKDGDTYIIETSKPTTVQYGALYGNERDGGGYVPTNTGSCSGSLAYFTVPYQSGGEQEIRIVSWDSSNNVKLYRYNSGSWILMKDWNMGQKTFQEWVGKNNGNVSYSTVFKVECSFGKRVSIFEGNWFETGAPGTSDMATMMSSENGTCSGNYFIAYMAPPGDESNVYNPISKSYYNGQFTHLYVFSHDTAHIQIKDAHTGGTDFSRSYTILPERYVDCAISLAEWKSIYNGTGLATGGSERPYLIVTSDNNVSVMNTNFNDNWMMYFGSSQYQSFKQNSTSTSSTVIPGQSLTVTSKVEIKGIDSVKNVSAELAIEGGLKVVSSTFNNVTANKKYNGCVDSSTNIIKVAFDSLPNLSPNGSYNISTVFTGSVMNSVGEPVPNNSVSGVTTLINGTVNGVSQQSTSIESVALNSYNASNLLYDFAENTGLENTLTDSWTVSTIDYDGDGDDDLFFTDMVATKPNRLFKNNGSGVFTAITTGSIVTDLAKCMSCSWADFDNDGDMDVVVANNTSKPCFFYVNNGDGTFTKNTTASFTKEVGYYHHASWVDVNNDGQVELYLGNYWPTRLNELWKREADGSWKLWADNLLSQIAGTATGMTWSDYDNDGFQDLIILNNEGNKNRMYHNKGNGEFETVTNEITSHGGNSVGSTWGDIDNDGDLDLFICNASNKDNELYHNKGAGLFSLVTTGSIVHDKGHSHGAVFGDIDKDGDLDLYVSNDQGVKFLYLNDGEGNFTRKTDEWPSSNFGKSYSASLSDIDMDGDLDIVAATSASQKNFIFTANNNAKKWIKIRCVGTKSNKSAIGAKVKVYANGKWQTREITSQNGFGGQSSYRQHFGLGSASIIDSIEIIWPSGLIQKLNTINPNQNIIITEANSTVLKAKAFYDANSNCILDSGEILLEHVKFQINNGKSIAYTNKHGELAINLGLGSYTIAVSDSQYTSTCTNPDTFSIQSLNTTKVLGNFALKPKCTGPNLVLSASSTIMRLGFPSKYIIEANNTGQGSASNTVLTATLPMGVTPTMASISWDSVSIHNNNKVITWNLGNMNYGGIKLIELNYVVSNTLLPGSDVECAFTITEKENDCNTSDNSIIDFQSIYGSLDPNDILAYPHGNGSSHFISNNQEITYRIRFQNVGNYMTDNVLITDEIPEQLDINSIKNTLSSHPYQTTIEGRRLSFLFTNIQLPDSGSNMEGSNGYIQFTIDQVKNKKGGHRIENEASITFDYNEPMNTNQVFHTVVDEANIKSDNTLILIPNPSSISTLIIIPSTSDDVSKANEIIVQNAEGIIVATESFQSNMGELNVSSLPSGFYMIKVKDNSGKIYHGKLMIVR